MSFGSMPISNSSCFPAHLVNLWKQLSEKMLFASDLDLIPELGITLRCAVLKRSGNRGPGTMFPCSFEPQPKRLQFHGWSKIIFWCQIRFYWFDVLAQVQQEIWKTVCFYPMGGYCLIWCFAAANKHVLACRACRIPIDFFFAMQGICFCRVIPCAGWCVDLALHRMPKIMCSLQSGGLPSTLLHPLALRVCHGARHWPLLNGQFQRPLPKSKNSVGQAIHVGDLRLGAAGAQMSKDFS